MIQGQGYLLRSLIGQKMLKIVFLVLDYPWGLYIYIYPNFKNGDSIFLGGLSQRAKISLNKKMLKSARAVPGRFLK